MSPSQPPNISNTDTRLKSLNNYTLCVCVHGYSVVSDSLQPHGLQPTRLLCP